MTQITTTDVDPAAPTDVDTYRAAAFAERMADVLNHAALALMTSIGHRVGLFDTMAALPPVDQRDDRSCRRARRAVRARVARCVDHRAGGRG